MLSGIVEFLGWFGAVTVLAGYILFSTGKLPNGPVYQLFNLVGGVSVAINVAAHHAVPSTIVNGIWAIVAVVVLVRMAAARRTAKRGGLESVPTLSTEPPATTAVLPVIGPAVHAHDAAATAVTDATPSLRDMPAHTEAERARREPAAPMTASVPVITATIALALVSAAQEQHRAQRDGQHRAQRDGQHRAQPDTQRDAQPGAQRDDQQATAADRVG